MYLTLEGFLLADLSYCSLLPLHYLISKNIPSISHKPRLNRGPLLSCILISFASFLCTIPYDAYIGNRHVILFFILGYGLLMWLMLHYNMKNKHGFLYLFCVIIR